MKNKKLMSLLLVFFFFLSNIVTTSAAYPVINAKASILVDYNTGSVLYQDNIDEQLGIASITKLMSVYIVLEEMEKQDIKLEDQYKISKRVSMLKSQSPDISGAWHTEGEYITIQKLLELSLVYSDNSAIMQLAEITSGSESAHVEKMNKQAQEWGLENTVFYNVTGLTMVDYGDLQLPGVDSAAYNKSTARETASMVKKILDDHPEILTYTSMTSVDFKGEKLNSYNIMLPGLSEEYPGVTGLKTGTSDEAGSCFTGFYTYNGTQYISVVLGAESSVERFTETKKMYNWVQTQNITKAVDKETSFEFDLNGDIGFTRSLYPKTDVLSVSNAAFNATLTNVKYNPTYFDENNRLIKDIPVGETVLTITLQSLKEDNVTTVDGDANSFDVDLVSAKQINHQGKVLTFFSSIFTFVNGLFSSILKI